MPNIFVVQDISSTITVPQIMTTYSHQNVLGHISLNSQPFLMVQGANLMGLCVGVWGMAHVIYETVSTG